MATGKEGVLREVARGELLLLGNPHASYPGCQVHTAFAHPRMKVEKWPRVTKLGKMVWASAYCLVAWLSLELLDMTLLGLPWHTVLTSGDTCPKVPSLELGHCEFISPHQSMAPAM